MSPVPVQWWLHQKLHINVFVSVWWLRQVDQASVKEKPTPESWDHVSVYMGYWQTKVLKERQRRNDKTLSSVQGNESPQECEATTERRNDKALSPVQGIESPYPIGHTEALETKRQQRRNDKDQIVSHKAISSIEGGKVHRTLSPLCVRQRKPSICKAIRQGIERWSRRDWTLIQEGIGARVASVNTKSLARGIELDQEDLFNRG